MKADQISEMRAAHNKVGHITLAQDGALHFEGTMEGRISESEALHEIALAWNELGALLDEVVQLAEDHARMTHTLRSIGAEVIDAMQGTSRSQIAADWWAAVLDADAS